MLLPNKCSVLPMILYIMKQKYLEHSEFSESHRFARRILNGHLFFWTGKPCNVCTWVGLRYDAPHITKIYKKILPLNLLKLTKQSHKKYLSLKNFFKNSTSLPYNEYICRNTKDIRVIFILLVTSLVVMLH